MSLPKLGEKAKGILEAPEKDLRKLLENTPLGAPPKLSAALGKAGKGVEEEIELPVELPELPVKGEKKAGGKSKLPELPELPKLFGEGKGKAGLSPPELGKEGKFPPKLGELPKIKEIVPFKFKEEKTAGGGGGAGGGAPPAGGGPTAPAGGGGAGVGGVPTPEVKEGILRKEGKVKEGMLRT